MKLQILKSIRSDHITVVASLPDMGRVGGLVSAFLSQSLNAEQVAEIASSDKPWVTYADGVVSSANEVYRIFYDDRRRLLILTGESQPQDPGELYRLCNTFLDYAQSVGTVRRLYGAGGYLRENIVGAPRVCGVVNRPELKAVLAKAGIEPALLLLSCQMRRKHVCSDTQICREHRAASRTSRPLQFSAAAPKGHHQKIGSSARRLRRSLTRSLTRPDPHDPRASSFTLSKEMATMTITLEIHIEQLRRELKNADPAERHQIEAELEIAEAELAAAIAEQEGTIDAAPPF